MSSPIPPRYGPILPRVPGAHFRSASALMLLALIGCLAVIVDAAAVRTMAVVRGRLAGTLTVVVWSHGLESADAAAARAGAILAEDRRVASATPLDPAPGDALIARLMGAPELEAPDARFLDIKVNGPADDLASRLERDLLAQDLPARAVDHVWKDSHAGRMAAALFAAGALLPVGAILGFGIVGVVVARDEFRRAEEVMTFMRSAGASYAYLSGLVWRRIAGLALTAAFWGVAGAMLLVPFITRGGPVAALGGLRRTDLASPWPALILLACLFASLGAWLGSRAELRAKL